MKELFLPLLLTATSVLGYAVGIRAVGLSRRRLGWAVRQLCELAGLTVVFLAANLAIGLTVILATRALSGRFISVYLLNDMTLVAVSALQGVLFGCWRRSAAPSSSP